MTLGLPLTTRAGATSPDAPAARTVVICTGLPPAPSRRALPLPDVATVVTRAGPCVTREGVVVMTTSLVGSADETLDAELECEAVTLLSLFETIFTPGTETEQTPSVSPVKHSISALNMLAFAKVGDLNHAVV